VYEGENDFGVVDTRGFSKNEFEETLELFLAELTTMETKKLVVFFLLFAFAYSSEGNRRAMQCYALYSM